MTNDQGVTKSENVRHGDDLFWNDDETAFVREELYTKPVYDLEERTARFGEAVVYELQPARLGLQQETLGAIDQHDLTLIGPLTPLRHQTGTYRIVSHIFPFPRITFVVSQNVIKKPGLPQRLSV